jgi:hypothetical protein
VEPAGTCVFIASGEIEAQQIRAFLDAHGVPGHLRGEALRKTHGLTLDGLGQVEILVEEEFVEQARELLASADAGAFAIADDEEPD